MVMWWWILWRGEEIKIHCASTKQTLSHTFKTHKHVERGSWSFPAETDSINIHGTAVKIRVLQWFAMSSSLCSCSFVDPARHGVAVLHECGFLFDRFNYFSLILCLPGMNAAVRAVVRMGLYVGAKVYFIHEVSPNVLVIMTKAFFFFFFPETAKYPTCSNFIVSYLLCNV